MWQETLVEIGCVTGGTADPSEAAAEALEVIRQIVPFAAGCVSRYDPLTGEHHTLANAGYTAPVRDYLNTQFVDHDVAYRTMRGAETTPLRWRDVRGVHYRDTRSAQEVFLPNGFVEGVTVCLYTRSGRYTGSMHLSVDDEREPTDQAMPALVVLQTMLSGIADAMRSLADPLTTLAAGEHAAVIGRDGRSLPVSGAEPGPHLAPGGALATDIAHRLADGEVPPRFWWTDAEAGWHQIRLYPVAGGAVVIETSAMIPHDLTVRELDVLTLMTAGCSNPQIASALVVAPKTAAKHVEHVLAKLGCASRTEAAVHAIQEGLVHLPSTSRREPALHA